MKKIVSFNFFLLVIGSFFYIFLFSNYPVQVFFLKIFYKMILIKEYILLSICLAYLSRKRFLKNNLYLNKYFIYSFINILLLPQIIKWAENLSYDSFLTIFETNFSEILFYLQTLYHYLIPDNQNVLLFTIFIFFYVNFIFFENIFISKKLTKLVYKSTLLILLYIIFLPIYDISKELKNRSSIERNFEHFSLDEKKIEQSDLDIFIYLGESTSSMNMGLYGYFRNTTPNLSNLESDKKFIFFDNILSNHTHTSPSLISALSFKLSKNDELKDIFSQKRVSVFDFLNFKNDLKIYSYENKSILYKTIFKNTKNIKYNNSEIIKDKIKNNSTDYNNLTEIVEQFLKKTKRNKIYLFHSYAGHGPYLDNIDENFKQKVDNFFDKIPLKNIFGDKNIQILDNLENYDSTVKYIDHNLNYVIKNLDKYQRPAIFIYFADHGESIYTSYAHDSSRPLHEMIRVPLIIYFNEIAYKKFKNKFDKYKDLSKNKNISTLSQFPMTILDLKNIKHDKLNDLVNNQIIGDKKIQNLSKILIRKESTAINQNEFLDLGTKMYLEINKNENINNDMNICYGRSNSIGKIIRGSLIVNCLETDISFVNDGFKVTHSTKENGLNLSQYFSIIKNNNISIWLDLKNINKENCNIFFKELRKFKNYYKSIFLEINYAKDLNNKKFIKCLEQNYLDFDIGLSFEAVTEICNLKKSDLLVDCEYFKSIKYLIEKKIIKNFSVNYQKKDQVGNFFKNEINLNFYNIKIDEISDLKNLNSRFITFDNNYDPNNL